MNSSAKIFPILLALLAMVLGGCMHARPLETARLNIEDQLPGAQFESEFKMTLGRFSMALIRKMVDDEDTEALRHIRKVQLAAYRTVRLPEGQHVGQAVRKAVTRRGWKPVTEINGPDASVQILMRMEGDRAKDLMLAAVEEEEMVLIRLYGDVQNLIDEMIEEEVLDVPGVVTADLTPEAEKSVEIVITTEP